MGRVGGVDMNGACALIVAIVVAACGPSVTDGDIANDIGGDIATDIANDVGGDIAGDIASDGTGVTPLDAVDPADVAAGDPPSHGGTITFEQIGAPGWYPSRRDPDVGPCDAYQSDTCCLARHEVTGDALTPWNEDLIMTLRGPMNVAQLAVYQPSGGAWALVSSWSRDASDAAAGVSFRGNDTERDGFDGSIGSECLVDVASATPFACGPGSEPFCSGDGRYIGWAGSKLIVLLATMPHAGDASAGPACSDSSDGNWYDAPWIGLSLGELVRAGAFSGCHCYAKNPDEWWLGDGCGQFNVFEVVNDNNEYRNLELFSTNFFGYAGYVGEGPCGERCDLTNLGDDVDLIDKDTSGEAASGAVATPDGGPGAAFRRPSSGYRYFVMLLDEGSRSVQLAVIHPSDIPSDIGTLLPALPPTVASTTVQALLALRLPR